MSSNKFQEMFKLTISADFIMPSGLQLQKIINNQRRQPYPLDASAELVGGGRGRALWRSDASAATVVLDAQSDLQRAGTGLWLAITVDHTNGRQTSEHACAALWNGKSVSGTTRYCS